MVPHAWPWMWYQQQESNLYLALRRRSFYPLNYAGKGRDSKVFVGRPWGEQPCFRNNC